MYSFTVYIYIYIYMCVCVCVWVSVCVCVNSAGERTIHGTGNTDSLAVSNILDFESSMNNKSNDPNTKNWCCPKHLFKKW